MIQTLVYEISPDLKEYPIETITWENLNDYAYESFSDVSEFLRPEKMQQAIQEFLTNLKNKGFKIGYVPNPKDNMKEIPYIKSNHIAKKNYFHTRYKTLQQKIANMTIDDFMTEGINEELHALIDNPTTNSVCLLSEDIKTLDNFIRTMQNGKEYYIGTVLIIA